MHLPFTEYKITIWYHTRLSWAGELLVWHWSATQASISVLCVLSHMEFGWLHAKLIYNLPASPLRRRLHGLCIVLSVGWMDCPLFTILCIFFLRISFRCPPGDWMYPCFWHVLFDCSIVNKLDFCWLCHDCIRVRNSASETLFSKCYSLIHSAQLDKISESEKSQQKENV